MRRSAPLATLLAMLGFASGPTLAGDEVASHWCATSAETIERVRDLSRWSAGRTALPEARPESTIRRRGDVIILPPDERTTPFNRQVDLEGKTLTFRPASGNRYELEVSDLLYEPDIGTPHELGFDGSNLSVPHTIDAFAFPFQGRSVRSLHVSEHFGIFTNAPVNHPFRSQVDTLEAFVREEGVIAPYLHTSRPRTLTRTTRRIFISESAERLAVTWRYLDDPSIPGASINRGEIDIQAVLFPDGTIRFSYGVLDNVDWGAVLITTGDEPARDDARSIARANDPTGDSVGPLAALLDISQVEIDRIAGSELLRVRVHLGGRIFPNAVSRASLRVTFSPSSTLSLDILSPNSFMYCISGRGCGSRSPAVSFSETGVDLFVLDRHVNESGTIGIATLGTSTIDSLTIQASLGSGAPLDSDLSGADGAAPSLPILEAFTLPALNPDAVWEIVRDEFQLLDAEVDAVAIFQNFTTDIRVFATAYSTVGNSGADGVWADSESIYGSDVPRTPALLHMNEVEPDPGDPGSVAYRDFLLTHELGHRWLYGITILENGEHSYVLGPGSGHPAQYVHTPAAFPVRTDRDYSVMGGSWFEDLGGGLYRTPHEDGANGYSWHELYLMGLAAPSEVEGWFYLADTDPPLGDAYNPPLDLTVSGSKRAVTLPDIVASMGARSPAYDESQKVFRVLFVLLEKPGERNEAEEVITETYATSFVPYFAAVTGDRGRVTTSLPAVPEAAFTSPTSVAVGEEVAFRDTSDEYPVTWEWDFGDGAVSSVQYPRHRYRQAGEYTVTLRVTNSRGTSTATGTIVVEELARRRPTRR